MASARLRKTFQFPSDSEGSDEDSTREEMDEEEQENLIETFKVEDKSKNELYTLLFTLLPVISSGSLLPSLLAPKSTASMRILSLLALTALLSTAYICRYIPSSPPTKSSRSIPVNPTSFADFDPNSGKGPIQNFLIPLTSITTLLLFIAAFGVKGREGPEEGFWILCIMPGVIFWVVMISRSLMGSVGPQIGQLEEKRYRLKGA